MRFCNALTQLLESSQVCMLVNYWKDERGCLVVGFGGIYGDKLGKFLIAQLFEVYLNALNAGSQFEEEGKALCHHLCRRLRLH